MTTYPVYDNYEISPCHRLDEDGLPDPSGGFVEVCREDEAEFWTLYGHIEGQGVEAIGDFRSREAAERVCYRITGEPFPGSYASWPRLRLMHGAPRLLEAIDSLLEQLAGLQGVSSCVDEDVLQGEPYLHACAVRAELEQARPPLTPAELDIEALLAQQRQIAVLWSIEDVLTVRPDLSDDQA